VEDDETDGSCSTQEEKTSIYGALLGRPEERMLLEKPYARMGVNTIKTILKKYDRLM
jgi:hypothetical protein